MSFASPRRTITLLAVVVATAACDSPTEVCTLVGCDSGLTVQLSGLPVGAFTVEVFPESPALDPPVYRYECTPGPQPCSTRVLFPGLYVEQPYVRVTSALGTVTHHEPDVTYQTSYPNGRQCGPECRSATVSVGIPE